ncbi:hydrolethalus syndrome protein 1 homolog isoform X2 [Aplysia californica]|uniref:Hydrolethalus syndrome protein 1 homolog isoform X2 n=1 Tax=Aplysia californica TaxID=6500 RepID=A0ABM0JNL7_APLCA|nr:hydrolethalus syndrome protein 1 homolog isoform X2 [Aplysia californica]
MEFTDDEIREELARLGYQNVPSDKLIEFKKDLLKLIHTERSKNTSLNSSTEEQRQSRSPVVKENSEFVTGNFTNHGSQWIEKEFREDWQYRGGDKTTTSKKYDYSGVDHHDRACKSATATRSASEMRRNGVPGSYANYELPLDVENGKNNDNQSNSMRDGFEDDSGSKMIKRKTCRKMEDGCRRIDESFCDSETDGIFEIYERIKSMAMRDCECGKSRPTTADVEPPYRLKGKKNAYPSFIRKMEPPHTRNLVRQKPFDRLRMYQKLWKAQPAAGEAHRFELHKAVHAKLLEKDEIKVDHKVYVPNRYVVPTEKPRNALRWKVRQCLERYEMPPHGFYHET